VEHSGSEGPGGDCHRHRDRRGSGRFEAGRSRDRDAGFERSSASDPGGCSAAIVGLSHRRPSWLRRGPAQEPGQERYGGMRQSTRSLAVPTRGKGLYEISDRVARGVAETGRKTGLLTVFIQHTSASLTIQENAVPDVVADLNDHFNRLAPEDNKLYRHTVE